MCPPPMLGNFDLRPSTLAFNPGTEERGWPFQAGLVRPSIDRGGGQRGRQGSSAACAPVSETVEQILEPWYGDARRRMPRHRVY